MRVCLCVSEADTGKGMCVCVFALLRLIQAEGCARVRADVCVCMVA